MAIPVRIRRPHADPLTGATLPALLAQLYARRGATGHATEPALAHLLPGDTLHGLAAAAALLADQVQRDRPLVVVGDFDADGATGSALALLGLRALGATQVSHLTPSRFAHGYGLSPAIVEAAAARDPALLITVDNGIASLEGVARARERGIPVLVTDHHLAGAELPAAAAIVNPNQPGCAFPSKHLAGVGVMFYLLVATRGELRRRGHFGPTRPEPNLAHYLDLVALGTVADVVTLDHNNRILVEQGLRRIRAGHCRPGVRALLEVAGRTLADTTARDLGFAAGPRLNAAGRLQDMGLGVECLVTAEGGRAVALAQQLHALNAERREIEDGMRAQAEAIVADLAQRQPDHLPAAWCVSGADWHQGVSGIVAARVRERWHCPVIAFAPAGADRWRGSARSIEGLHVRDLIDTVTKRHPGLVTRFGGHAMAAGLEVPAAALDEFSAAFTAAVAAAVGDQARERAICSDGALPPALLTLDTAAGVRRAGPWGKGFPEPVFDAVFAILAHRVVGERHLKLTVRAPGGAVLDAIAFNQADALATLGAEAHLAYRLDVNRFRGECTLQLLVEHIAPAAEDTPA